ncbi:MAG TPA: class III extradiol dioxygenase family protein [Sphingomonadaceae bacterium]|nr:class III extradiol dioxygenase family protein [Sphingomonadaceae bacterium]
MSSIIGGVFTSHVPGIGSAIARGLQQDPYWKPFFDGFAPVHRWLAEKKPDVAVVFYNDHGLNFFLDAMPTFAIGAAPEYRHEDEGWGISFARPFKGYPELSWHVIEEVVESEFDPVMCQKMVVDHAVAVPYELLWPGEEEFSTRLVPIAINTVQHPLPSPKRCRDLGLAVGRALRSWEGDETIVVLGTGGLSHQLEGKRAGHLNVDYDRFCLDNLVGNPDALLQHSTLEIVELAGSQGVEILNWIAARAALGDDLREISRNYHVPISNTAAATMLVECRELVSA